MFLWALIVSLCVGCTTSVTKTVVEDGIEIKMKVEPWEGEAMQIIDQGSGVYLFLCGQSDQEGDMFGITLAKFKKDNPKLVVTATTARPRAGAHNSLTGYWVITYEKDFLINSVVR